MFLKICDVCGNVIRENGTATIVVENEEGPDTIAHLCSGCDEAVGGLLKEIMKKHGRYREPETEVVADGGSGFDAETLVCGGEQGEEG